jgi:hypothetical protein
MTLPGPGGKTQMHLLTPPLAELLATVYYVHLNSVLPTRMQQQSDQEISKQQENRD